MSTFFRLNNAEDKGATLRSLCASATADDVVVFERDVDDLLRIPGAPLAYWAASELVRAFGRLPSFEKTGRFAGQGVATADNFRFLRLHWETRLDDRESWFGLAKGGTATAFYADIYLSIRWADDGAEFKSWAETLYDNSHWSRITMNYSKYGLGGLTWSRRAANFAVRALPEHCVFGDKGPAIFTPTQTPESLLATCALLNSRPFVRLLELQLARLDLAKSYETGAVSRTPVPELESEERIAALARSAWSTSRRRDSTNETSHAFLLPALLNERITEYQFAANEQELAEVREAIDALASELYALKGDVLAEKTYSPSANESENDTDEPAEEDDSPVTDEVSVEGLNSWLVGVAFGRFDSRLATGERAVSPEPEPFDPLPVRSPGMVPEGEEPAERPDILVDDQGHADDLAARVRAVAERVKVDVPESLRAWLAKDFFPLHIRMYSKSRRKAPIYWQLATFSASYSVGLYIHAFTKDTLFRVQNDYVAPKLAHEERRLETLSAEQRDGANATERKALAEQQALVEELRAFLAEVKLVAPLWNPDLDDGVIINFAPLWRLVPQHKPWQKELKKTWDALCDGKYDWAHLAMHLWPERVVPKCAVDRSLAIAHDLENVFWEEDDDGKWQPVKVPQAEIDQLIAERTSAAVKDALQSLLDAPPPATGRSGGRRTSGRGSARRSQGTTGRQRSGASAPPDPAVIDAIKQAIEATGDGASKADVLTTTGLSDAQWTGAIAALLAEGSVTKSGAGRGTRYHRLPPES